MSGEGDTPYTKLDNIRVSFGAPIFGDDLAWRPPPDLDQFFSQIYNYYRGKGFKCSVLSLLFNLLTFTWTGALFLFLFAFFDFTNFSWDISLEWPTHPLFYFALIGLSFVWICLTIRGLNSAYHLKQMHWFFYHKLLITEEEIQSVKWGEVVERLIQVPGLCRTKEELTVLDVCNRIMRKENFLIGLINKRVMNLDLPFVCTSNVTIFTKSLEWGISFVIFRFFFHSAKLRYSRDHLINVHDRVGVVKSLQIRFLLMGVLSLILSPFILVILVIYFILRYGEELRNKPSFVGLRSWSRFAHWEFREFNELPHELDDRLNLSVADATHYLDQFTSNSLILFAKFVQFVCGSVVIVLVVLSFLQPSVLEEEILLGRNGIWWIAVCGTILAIARAFILEDTFVFQPEQYFESVSACTHYRPNHWTNCRSPVVVKEFSSLFEYRILGLGKELLGVLLVPFIFLFSLPQCADEICQFMGENTVEVEGVGEVCSFANFDLFRHGNAKYGAPASVSKVHQSRHGKMEKSFLGFVAKHPNFPPQEEDQKQFIRNMSLFFESSDLSSSMRSGSQLGASSMFFSAGSRSSSQVTEHHHQEENPSPSSSSNDDSGLSQSSLFDLNASQIGRVQLAYRDQQRDYSVFPPI